MSAFERQKYFIFMDESGNNAQDRFFALGILMVHAEEVAELFNFLERISSKIKQRSREKMAERLKAEYAAGNSEKIINTAIAPRLFEMKFKAINKENEDLYIHILRKYFSLSNVRMCVLVFDKHDDAVTFTPERMSHWQRYLNNAAMLITNNMQQLPHAEFVVLADQMSQPAGADDYENALVGKIKERLAKKGGDPACIWGALRIESHASTFLQLVDIFVGAVGYDFMGVQQYRKEAFIQTLRAYLGVTGNIDYSFTHTEPNYFSVWRYRSK